MPFIPTTISSMTEATSEELHLVQIFRRRLLSLSLEDGQSSDPHLLRWIRAREGDLQKAEGMLRAHLAWRKQYGIGPSLLYDWTPSAYLTNSFSVKFVGFDPTGKAGGSYREPLGFVRGTRMVIGAFQGLKKSLRSNQVPTKNSRPL
jgi:hypothetical protein